MDTEGETLYVAGNAEHVAWRVTDWRAHAKWTSLLGEDTADGAEPHCDCRSFAWEASSGTLLMTSDGGVFARSSPIVEVGSDGGWLWEGVRIYGEVVIRPAAGCFPFGNRHIETLLRGRARRVIAAYYHL